MASKFENLPRTEIIKIMLDPWPFIRDQISKHGWSSNEVSQLAKVSASGVRALINGQNKRPSAEMQQKLLKLCVEQYTAKATSVGNAYLKPSAQKKKVAKKKAAKKSSKKKSTAFGWMA